MALIRWEPFREVESLQKEMNRLFDRLVPTDVGNGEKMGLSFIPAAEMNTYWKIISVAIFILQGPM